MSTPAPAPFAHLPSTLKVGDREVRRLGFGAMRLPGKDVWGLPDNIRNAMAVVRRAVELGVQFIDTSWYYGPHVSNPIIAEAIHPYAADLLIATKLGGKRTVDKGWAPFNRPEELRLGHEHDLRELRLDCIDVVHLRFIPNQVPFLESLDTLIQLRAEGKTKAADKVEARAEGNEAKGKAEVRQGRREKAAGRREVRKGERKVAKGEDMKAQGK